MQEQGKAPKRLRKIMKSNGFRAQGRQQQEDRPGPCEGVLVGWASKPRTKCGWVQASQKPMRFPGCASTDSSSSTMGFT